MRLSTKTYANLYSCYCISVISSAEAVKSRDKSRPRTMPKKGAFWVCRQMERGVGRAHILCRWRRKWVKFTGKNNTKKKQQKKKNTENKNETEETKQNKPMYNERVRLWKAAHPMCFFSFLLFLIIFIVDALNKCPGFEILKTTASYVFRYWSLSLLRKSLS